MDIDSVEGMIYWMVQERCEARIFVSDYWSNCFVGKEIDKPLSMTIRL